MLGLKTGAALEEQNVSTSRMRNPARGLLFAAEFAVLDLFADLANALLDRRA